MQLLSGIQINEKYYNIILFFLLPLKYWLDMISWVLQEVDSKMEFSMQDMYWGEPFESTPMKRRVTKWERTGREIEQQCRPNKSLGIKQADIFFFSASKEIINPNSLIGSKSMISMVSAFHVTCPTDDTKMKGTRCKGTQVVGPSVVEKPSSFCTSWWWFSR